MTSATLIKGIKTADNVVHKMSGEALNYGKTCVSNPYVLKYIPFFILGHDYSEVPVGSELTFFYKEYNSELGGNIGANHNLKVHKQQNDPNTLYFSPEFSDSNLYITSSDLDSAANNSFWVSFTSDLSVSNYVQDSTYNVNFSGNGEFAVVVDTITALLAQQIYNDGRSGDYWVRISDDFALISDHDGGYEFLPTNSCS